MLAYDDEFSIQYMKKNLRPYWRRNGDDAAALLGESPASAGEGEGGLARATGTAQGHLLTGIEAKPGNFHHRQDLPLRGPEGFPQVFDFEQNR